MAWQCANFMNCFTKTRVTVDKLLNKMPRGKKDNKPRKIKEEIKDRRRKREEKEFWGE